MLQLTSLGNLFVPLHLFNREERGQVHGLARMPDLLDTFVGEEHLLDFLLGKFRAGVLEVESSTGELAQALLLDFWLSVSTIRSQ